MKKSTPHKTPILSVIIPIYNVVPYLAACLESVVRQGFGEDEIEVIMVNDGSTDGSDQLAEIWANSHPNFHLVHQKNQGLSAARNTGIDHATGEYIVFLDSDDLIAEGAYREMLDIVRASGSDFITGNVFKFSKDNRKAWTFARLSDLFQAPATGLNLAENPEYIRDFVAWNKIYRRQFFLDTKVRFPAGQIYEDIATSPILYYQAKAFDVYEKPLYFWRVTPTGITQTIKPVKALDRLLSLKQISDYFKKVHAPEAVWREFDFAIVDYNLRWVFLDIWQFNKSAHQEIIDKSCELMEHIDEAVIARVQQPIADWARLAKNGDKAALLAILQKPHNVPNLPIGQTALEHSSHHIKRYANAIIRRVRDRSKTLARRLKVSFIYMVYRPLVQLLPIDDDLVVFSSYWGRKFSLSDAPSILCLELIQHSDRYKCIVFAAKRSYDTVVAGVHELAGKDANIKVVKNQSLAYFYYLWRAKYLFNDVNFAVGFRMNKYVEKRPGQIEVQTTHGIPFKKMGLDEPMNAIDREIFKAKSRRYDYLVSSSPFVADIFAKSHGITPKILQTGLPQNDFLFHKTSASDKVAIKQKYGIATNKKIILYSPTFRYGNGHFFPYLVDFHKLHQQLGDDYQIVVKLHPFNNTDLGSIDFRDLTNFAQSDNTASEPFVKLLGKVWQHDNFQEVFVSGEKPSNDEGEMHLLPGDINELMLIADALITDYSSVMFNYAHLDKPAIFFTPDIAYYQATRGSYFDLEEIAPGQITRTTDDLAAAIQLAMNAKKWHNAYGAKAEKFKHDFLIWETGNASHKILTEIGVLDK